jgi:hypothetical protein
VERDGQVTARLGRPDQPGRPRWTGVNPRSSLRRENISVTIRRITDSDDKVLSPLVRGK